MLEVIQKKFLNNLLAEENNLDFISSDFALERFEVHKNTVLQNLRRSLQITFPGIWELVGKECANQLALFFITTYKNLPSKGHLEEWGEEFVGFLKTIHELKGLPYLSDFADFEWKKHLSLFIGDYSDLAIASLNVRTEIEADELKLSLLPGVFLYSSIFPIIKISELVLGACQDNIDLSMGPTFCIIRSFRGEVFNYVVSKEQLTFLEYLKDGFCLREAYERVLDYHPEFDITATLELIFSKKIFKLKP